MEPRDKQKIGSIRTFIERLEKLNLDEPSNDVFYFRGHTDHEKYKLQPTIYREPAFIENEHRMFREIIMRCPNDFSSSLTTFEKLVKMQHYKLPTRLLDLTENPLIALLFAVKGKHDKDKDKDGEVLIFKVPKKEIKYYDSDTVSILSNLAKLKGNFNIKNIKNKSNEKFNEDNNIRYLLHEIKDDKPYFESKIKVEVLESVVCVKPKLDNPRIIRQDGAFFLFGIQDEKKNPAKIPSAYKYTTETYRLIINKYGKEKIYRQLSTIGINDVTMFPEIDYVSDYLKDKFKNEFNNDFKIRNNDF